MTSAFRMAILMLIVMTVLTGLAYPLAITGVAQLVFPHKANGSLIKNGDTVVGSTLIGQSFSKPEYFHPRPSAGGYDPLRSGGTNLAPSSQRLTDSVTAAVQTNQSDNLEKSVPGDLVTSSASGLDPDISPAAAAFQVSRVAKARGMTEEQVIAIVKQYTKGRMLGILGEPRVNVLRLNLALDRASQNNAFQA